MNEPESNQSVFNHVYGRCPNCGEDGDEDKHIVEILDRHKFMSDWGVGETWTEVWKCHQCEHSWEEFNGYP